MFFKKIIIIFILLIFYQTTSHSKSSSFDDQDFNNLSKYFSGIVALESKNNSLALDYFNSSRILLNKHDPYLQKFVTSLVLERKVNKAVNTIKYNSKKSEYNFFEAYILIALESLKKNNINEALKVLENIPENLKKNRFNKIIANSLIQYLTVFSEKKIIKQNYNFWKFIINFRNFSTMLFSRQKYWCFFFRLVNSSQADYSRYIYFYLTFLTENKQFEEAKILTDELSYINTTLLLSQGKSWIENNQFNEFSKFFSCKNHNDIVSEFFFLISNLYSSQNEFKKSNFYLSLSNYLNPKFIFNLSLVSENFYFNKDYEKSKKVLKNFDKNQDFYYWYRIKKEAQIISKTRNKKESLNYITSKFKKIKKPNNKFLFDVANFNKNSKEYKEAIKYYSIIIDSTNEDNYLKKDLLYRRGSSYERLGDYFNADKDLLYALKIDPDDSYVLNYLAYSWLERNHKIDEAIIMLEKAYESNSDDPYIIDSIGWAYYLVNDFKKAEKFLRRAVQLMPDDPIVNDHYGDILWKLDRKIQARYFWSMVLKMKDTEKKIIDDIKNKLIEGPKNS